LPDALPISAADVAVRRARSCLRRQELEGLAVAVGALADDPLRCELRDHRVPPPLLALVDVREMDLDDRHLDELDGVADRIAVVRPCAGIDDHPVDVVQRVVAPLDVLTLAVRLPAPDAQAELVRPAVDAGLE